MSSVTIEADQMKPTDAVVYLDQARVEWVDHTSEFHVRFAAMHPVSGRVTARLPKVQRVTVVRAR